MQSRQLDITHKHNIHKRYSNKPHCETIKHIIHTQAQGPLLRSQTSECKGVQDATSYLSFLVMVFTKYLAVTLHYGSYQAKTKTKKKLSFGLVISIKVFIQPCIKAWHYLYAT